MAYGIDIGSSSLKVVGLRPTMRGFRVIGAGRRPSPWTEPKEKSEDRTPKLSKLLYDTVGGRGGVGVVGLSGRDINLQVVNQPKTTPVNYRTLMRYEVDQRREAGGDVYVDWCTLREPDEYFPQYLAMVGVGKSAFVDARVKVATGARIEVRDAVPNAFALYAVYRNCYGAEGGTQLLLDIGADNMDIALVRGGRLIFARNVSSGARVFDEGVAGVSGLSPAEAEACKIQYGNLTAEEGTADRVTAAVHPAMRSAAGQIAGVIQSSISFARTQLQDKEMTVDKVYLSGGGARVRGLKEYLGSSLKIPVETLDPFGKVDASAMEAVEDFRVLPTDMAVAIGLAMIASAPSDGSRISLMPDAIRRRRNFFQRTAYMVAAGAVLLAAMLAITISAAARRSAGKTAYEEFVRGNEAARGNIEELDKTEKEQREVTAKAQLLMEQGLAGRGVMDVVAKLRRVLPDGINVTRLEFVDLSERASHPLPRKRVLFHLPGRGMVIGSVAREGQNDGSFTLSTGEEIAAGEVDDIKIWMAPSKGVMVEGEIDENIKGGAAAVLDAVKDQLSDPSRGVSADIPYREPAPGKPGWQVFRMMLRYE